MIITTVLLSVSMSPPITLEQLAKQGAIKLVEGEITYSADGNCEEFPAPCGCCAYAAGIGHASAPVESIEDFAEYFISSSSVVLEGTLVYPAMFIGSTTLMQNMCDGCEGYGEITTADGGYQQVFHDAFPLDAGSPTPLVVLTFEPFVASTANGTAAQCGGGKSSCCLNVTTAHSFGLLTWGEGQAWLGWGTQVANPDLNNDGVVDTVDLVEVIINWGSANGDTGCDGETDVDDLLRVIQFWSMN